MMLSGESAFTGLIVWLIGLLVLWYVIRSAVLSALRQHHRETQVPPSTTPPPSGPPPTGR